MNKNKKHPCLYTNKNMQRISCYTRSPYTMDNKICKAKRAMNTMAKMDEHWMKITKQMKHLNG
jgi:hypothetical protein